MGKCKMMQEVADYALDCLPCHSRGRINVRTKEAGDISYSILFASIKVY